MSNDLLRRLKKGSLSLLINNLLTIISQLIFIVILSKILKPKDFGYQGTCLLFLELTVVFTYPSINKSIILKKDVSEEFIDNAIGLSLILCSSFGLLFLIAAAFLSFVYINYDFAFICFVLFLMLMIKGFYQPYQALFEKELRFKETSRYSLTAYWIGYFFMPLILAFLHFGYKSLIYGLLTYEVVMLFSYIKNYKIKFSKLKINIVKEILSDSKDLIVNSFFNQLATNGDYLVVSSLLGTKALGFYSQGYKIMKMPTTIIGNILNNMSFATFSKINDNDEKLSKAFIYLSFILALFSFPIFFLTYFYAQEIVLLLLGNKWLPTVNILKIFSLGVFLRMSYKIPGTILRAKSKFALAAKLQILYAANVILLSLTFIKFSIEGVAAATLVALIIQYILLTYNVNVLLKKSPIYFYKILFKPLFFSLVFFGIIYCLMYVFDSYLNIEHQYNFIIATIIAFLIAATTVYQYGEKIFGEPFTWWLEFIKRK